MDQALPPQHEMLQAFLASDTAYDGIFVTAVRTTGIFCRPSCTARKPHAENVEFFATPHAAGAAGYRACRRCRPLEIAASAPPWLQPLLQAVEADPQRRWTDQDLRDAGLQPERVRRWFQRHHGATFHAHVRARRLAAAFQDVRNGATVTETAFAHGYESLSGFADAFRGLTGGPPGHARGSSPAAVLSVANVGTVLGPVILAGTAEHLYLAEFTDRRMLQTQLQRLARHLHCCFAPGRSAPLDAAAQQLEQYFAGDRRRFDLPLRTPGSELQRQVWTELANVPYGQTCSYGELAARIGRPRAARPVGRAVGDNRLAIIVPCHRVVGADGRLTGYGGGLWRKQRLLELERRSESRDVALDPVGAAR